MPKLTITAIAKLRGWSRGRVYRLLDTTGCPHEQGQPIDAELLLYHKIISQHDLTTFLAQPPATMPTNKVMLQEIRLRLTVMEQILRTIEHQTRRSASPPSDHERGEPSGW